MKKLALLLFLASTLPTALAQTSQAAAWNDSSKAHFGDDPRKAFVFAQRAYAVARQTGDVGRMGTALSYGGSAQYLLGNLKTALQLYLRALPLFERLGEAKGISSVTNNVGNVQYDLGQYDQATWYYRRSLDMDRRRGDSLGVAGSYRNLANVASDQGHPRQSLAYNFRALRLYEQRGETREVGTTVNNIGHEYQRIGDRVRAERYLRKALVISEQLGDVEGQANVLHNLSKVYEQAGDYAKALEYLRRAERVGAEYKLFLRDVYAMSADISARQGQYQQAFDYQRRYTALNDTLRGKENTQYIADLQTRYETTQKEQRIALLDKENIVKNLQLDRNRTVLFSVVGGLLLALLLAGVLYNRNQLKQRANRELERANALIRRSVAEKETLLQEIHHRVKNNLQLVSSLLNWQTEGVTDEQTLRIIDEGRARVRSMALIHEHLYKSENLSEVSMPRYLGDLIDTLVRSYRTHEGVFVAKNLEPLYFDADVVVPLGLITSELVSNAFKYAFPNGVSGRVTIELRAAEPGYQFSVTDDGVGLPGDFATIRRQSLGLQLVETLAKQLKGTLRIESTGGTRFSLWFPGKKNP